MKDTVVGVLGVLVIVGSLGGAISLLEENVIDEGTPAAFDQTRWSADDCRTVTMIWGVDEAALAEHVEPWTPRTSGGEGQFRLTVWDCASNSVNNTALGSQSGAFALIPVEEPEDPRNVTREDWLAMPEAIGDTDAEIVGSLQGHGFPVAAGSADIQTTDAVASTQLQATVTTSQGQMEATAILVGDSPDSLDRDQALVAPGEASFAVASGSTSGDEQEVTLANVQASGDTWVERLGLDSEPDQALYAVEGESSFAIWDLPFEAQPPEDVEDADV